MWRFASDGLSIGREFFEGIAEEGLKMKKVLILGLLIFVGVAGWRVGESLSSDATGMAVGILLGVMAGIPTALLVLASGRRRNDYLYDDLQRRGSRQLPTSHQSQPYQQAPPVIIVTGGAGQQQSQQHAMGSYRAAGDSYGAQPAPRHFTVVGGEELDEDW